MKTTLQLLPLLALVASPLSAQESASPDPFVRGRGQPAPVEIGVARDRTIIIHPDGRKEIIEDSKDEEVQDAVEAAKPENAVEVSGVPVADAVPDSGVLSVRFEVFSLGVDDAGELTRGNVNDQDLYREIVGKLKKKEAKQETVLIVRAKPGETASVDSTKEQIYATEYQPATIVTSAGDDASAGDDENPQETGKKRPAAKSSERIHEVIPATPVSFETRKTGWTMQVEPQGQEGNRIDLAFTADYAAKVGSTTQGEGLSKIEMPVFETQKFQTQFDNFDGVPAFCGTMDALMPVGGAEGNRIWFAFLTVSHVKR